MSKDRAAEEESPDIVMASEPKRRTRRRSTPEAPSAEAGLQAEAETQTAGKIPIRRTAVRGGKTADAVPAASSPKSKSKSMSTPKSASISEPSVRTTKATAAGPLAALAEGVAAALAAAGGADYLATIARDDPKTFCALLTRLLPARAEGKAEIGIALRWDGPGDEA